MSLYKVFLVVIPTVASLGVLPDKTAAWPRVFRRCVRTDEFYQPQADAKDGVTDKVDRLLRTLKKETNVEQRIIAVEKLQELKDARAITALSKVTDEENGKLKIAMLNALAVIALKHEMPCPDALSIALKDDDANLRRLATNLIDVFDTIPEAFLPNLLESLEDEDHDFLRHNVAGMLPKVAGKNPRVIPALEKALKDRNSLVRHNAAISLWGLTKKADLVVPVIMRNRLDMSGSDDDQQFRVFMSFVVLRKIACEAPEEVARVLLQLLGNQQEDVRVRTGAAWEIGSIAKWDERSRQRLRKIKVHQLLEKHAMDPHARVRAAVSEALLRMNQKAEKNLCGKLEELLQETPEQKPPTTDERQSRASPDQPDG